MNNPDQSELFDLCRNVYEKTGWKTKLVYYLGEIESIDDYFVTLDKPKDAYEKQIDCYAYTSDYLLEKLPNIQIHKLAGYYLQVKKQSNDLYIGGYLNIDGLGLEKKVYSADTPLKALLKLTCALADSGELPNAKE